MRREQHFVLFLAAWSVVSMLNAVLNGLAGALPSLPFRGAALGVLLLIAVATRGPDRKVAGGHVRQTSVPGIAGNVYAALFAAIAVPSVAWRCLWPLDGSGLASLNRGASITFVFGTVCLILVRATQAGTLADVAGRQPA